jgi:uncharacterized membrane protein
MRRSALFYSCTASAVLLAGCDGGRQISSVQVDEARLAKGGASSTVTLIKLPSLGSNSEARAINADGTVIAGHAFDRAGMLYAVKWTLHNGAWIMTVLPYSGAAAAAGASNPGDVVGRYASSPNRAVLWSPQNVARELDCSGDLNSRAQGISADGQVTVGASGGAAVVWRATGCAEVLPLPGDRFGSAASASGDGSVVGGAASLVTGGIAIPVRWTNLAGAWSVEELDARAGRASAANLQGDLAGYVVDPCALANGCAHAMVWYRDGTSRLVPTGGERSYAAGINASGEVTGTVSSGGRDVAYVWSEASGFRDISGRSSSDVAYGISNVRADGSRLVVGVTMSGGAAASVWVVRNP